MVFFYLLSVIFLFVGIMWSKECISNNKCVLNSVWDIFYIFTFLLVLFLLIYLNFFCDALFWINLAFPFLLVLLFVIDVKIDCYFTELSEKEE